MPVLTATMVKERLGLSERFRVWLDQTEIPRDARDPELPPDAEADSLLKRLGVRDQDRAACLASRPDPEVQPELWWVLNRVYQDLVARIGRNPAQEGYMGWPALPESAGDAGRQLYVWVLLAAVPDIRRFHRERNIPDEVSWDSLAGLSGSITLWSAIYGGSGLRGDWMVPLLFRGVSYRLGRHVFDRGGGDLNVHIPAGAPLDPSASQASFDRAREFFPRHFPEEPVTSFVCHSWLLDDQWARYLPETSNIVRFQRRFQLLPEDTDANPAPGDADILQFVFHRDPDDFARSPDLIEELPQDTTFQRAFVTHLRTGGHWRARSGWFPIVRN
jgi:hypothetical protein